MSLIVYAENNDGDIVEWSDKLRVATLEVTINAEECSAGSSEVALDDSTADFYVRGLKPMYFVETEAEDDEYLGIIGPFWTERRRISRGNERTGSRRTWGITLRDLNSLLTYRVQKGTDAERDAETDVERMTWVTATAEIIGGHGDHGFAIEDFTFFFTDAPVPMSETSYIGTEGGSVINDCMQQSGANAYLYNAPTEYEPIRVGIWYGRTEREEYQSLHKISNILEDISPEVLNGFVGETPQYESGYVFPPSLDASLDRDPSRQITGALLQWDGGNTYGSTPIITPTLTRRDMVFSGELVKNSTQATERIERYLADLGEEDDAIECAVIVPAWLVHAFMPGHRVQFKNSYMPGYDDYVWMRVARVTYRQMVGEDGEALGKYELGLDLRAETPPGPALPEPPGPFVCEGGDYDATPSAIYPRLGQEDGNAAGVHYYWNAGDDLPDAPTPFWTGGSWSFPVYDGSGDFNVSNLNFWTMIVVGPGTLTVHTVADSRGGGHTTATMWRASVKHLVTPGVFTEDFTQDGVPGVDEVIEIPEDDAPDCVHHITISCPEHDGPGGMGANGCTWELADA